MKKLLLLTLLIAQVNFAQEEEKINKYLKSVYDNEQTGIKRGDEWIISPGDVSWYVMQTGILVQKGEKYGLITEKGDWVLKPEFTDIQEFYGMKSIIGYTVMNDKNEMAYYSMKGELIIPFAQQDLECYRNMIVSRQGDYHAVYDLKGQVLIPRDLHQVDVYATNTGSVFIYKGGQTSVYLDMKEIAPKNVTLVDHYYGTSRLETSIFDYYLFLSNLQNEPGILQDPVTGNNYQAKDFFPDTTKIEAKFKPLWHELIAKISDSTAEFSELETLSDFGNKTFVNVPVKLNSKQLELAAFPVTGISQEAATKYAEWLSVMYMNYFSTGEITWKFQLPAEEQWEKLALDGLGETMKANQVLDSVNQQGCFLFNYAGLPDCKSMAGYLKSSMGGGIAPVKSFNPDFLGSYNVFGNVAEMLATPGFSKGGSCIHKPYQSKIKNKISYSGPQPWLGFRLIAVPVPIG